MVVGYIRLYPIKYQTQRGGREAAPLRLNRFGATINHTLAVNYLLSHQTFLSAKSFTPIAPGNFELYKRSSKE